MSAGSTLHEGDGPSGPLPRRSDFPFVGPNLRAERERRDRMKAERALDPETNKRPTTKAEPRQIEL